MCHVSVEGIRSFSQEGSEVGKTVEVEPEERRPRHSFIFGLQLQWVGHYKMIPSDSCNFVVPSRYHETSPYLGKVESWLYFTRKVRFLHLCRVTSEGRRCTDNPVCEIWSQKFYTYSCVVTQYFNNQVFVVKFFF